MLEADHTQQRPTALDRVRDLAKELARSHPNAKNLVRELFLAFTSVYEEALEPESTRTAYAALDVVRKAIETMAPAALPSREFV